MNKGKTIFSQIMSLIPERDFKTCVDRYKGNYRARNMHILAFSLCKESDTHRSIATHYFKERGSIPYGQDSFK